MLDIEAIIIEMAAIILNNNNNTPTTSVAGTYNYLMWHTSRAQLHSTQKQNYWQKQSNITIIINLSLNDTAPRYIF